jgi:O-succinylbenzoate synthase
LVTLLVLNSTSRNGLAKGVKTLLTKDGFKVSQATNDATAYGGHGVLPGVGEIRFGPAAKAAATLLSYYVPGASLVATDSSATSVILSLGTKYKTLASAASVSTALSTNHLTETSAPPTPHPTASKSC